jgi:sporulation protein YtfJ
MSQKLPNMLESTIQKIREMVDVNSVIGSPITTPDGVTIIPVSRVSVGFGGGGSDFTSKNTRPGEENPFGGGVGGGVKVTPICFLVVKDGAVRMMPVAEPANTTADRIVEMVPDTLDKISAFFDAKGEKKGE